MEPEYQRMFHRLCRQETAQHKRMMHAIETGDHSDYDPHFYSLEQTKARERERADFLIEACLKDWPPGSKTMPFGDFASVVSYAGRIYGPRILWHLDYFKVLEPEAYVEAVPSAWSLAEFPGLALERRDWLRLWRKCGFVMDNKSAERPTESITVWRASWAVHKKGLSWTADEKRARWFLQARSGRMRLYRATVSPGRLLAHLHEEHRHEDEWIVDTRTLDIEEIAP